MSTDTKRQINPKSGYENMVNALMEQEIVTPFIPIALRFNVVAQEKWCWSTDPVDSFQMYQMDQQYLHDLIIEDGPGYMALSHAGHGINSYGLQYALRYGPLVVFFQGAFGGAYNDHEVDVCCINKAFNQISSLLETMPPDIAKKVHSKRIVLLWSNFRGVCNYGILDLLDLQRREHKVDVSSDTQWQFIPDQNQLFKDISKELKKLITLAQ